MIDYITESSAPTNNNEPQGQGINFAGEIKTSHNTRRINKNSQMNERDKIPTCRSQRLKNLQEKEGTKVSSI